MRGEGTTRREGREGERESKEKMVRNGKSRAETRSGGGNDENLFISDVKRDHRPIVQQIFFRRRVPSSPQADALLGCEGTHRGEGARTSSRSSWAS
eukprot:67078-Hanusia_phi.AAC.2